MKATKPFNGGAQEYSIWDAFEIPLNNDDKSQMDEISIIYFSLTKAQSSSVIYKSVNKPYAQSYAKKFLNDDWNVNISSTEHSVLNIFDISGERVFPGEANLFGWVIFIDKNIFANWGHECEYIFLVNDKKIITATKTMPPMNLALEEIQ